jgi:RimJ/RimL family protein N-acetyltransferase
MKNQLQFETERLILRPFTLSDAPLVQKLAGDKAIADTTLNIPYPYKDGMAEQWIGTHRGNFEKGVITTYAVTLKPDEKLAGAISLVINKRFERAEMGYWIGRPDTQSIVGSGDGKDRHEIRGLSQTACQKMGRL